MSESSSGQSWSWLHHRATWGAALAALGFLVTVALAVLSSQPSPSPASIALLLVLLAGILQFGSARLFHSVGRADPGLARSSVRRLLRMGQRAAQAESEVQSALEIGTVADQRDALGRVSVHLSYLQEGLMYQTQDWMEFHKRALWDVVNADDLSGETMGKAENYGG